MNFDFREQYKNYSTTDLLKIIRNPKDYQPIAVEAARSILDERKISEDEHAEVDRHFQELQEKERARAEKINDLKDKAADFLEPLAKPSEEIKPVRWLNIILALAAIYYLVSLFAYARRLIKEWMAMIFCLKTSPTGTASSAISNCVYLVFDLGNVFAFISLVYIPITFYLLFKRRRWGWILLFADNLLVILTTVMTAVAYGAKFAGLTPIVYLLSPLVIRGLFAYYLERKNIRDLFGISLKDVKKTSIVTIAIWTLFGLAYVLIR